MELIETPKAFLSIDSGDDSTITITMRLTKVATNFKAETTFVTETIIIFATDFEWNSNSYINFLCRLFEQFFIVAKIILNKFSKQS